MRHIGLPSFYHHAHGGGRGYPGGAGDVYGYLVGTGGGEPQGIRGPGLAVHRPGEGVNNGLVFPHRVAGLHGLGYRHGFIRAILQTPHHPIGAEDVLVN
ncbi:MAG: hypothetical protein D6732_13585 [Methanobacteriota archaeon]|nr:MAG: hypothetical protein D6732_13585 [Euryarchaeota archaeon]